MAIVVTLYATHHQPSAAGADSAQERDYRRSSRRVQIFCESLRSRYAPHAEEYPLPTSDELLIHQEELEIFVTAQHLKQRLMSHLDTTSDGWIPIHLWEDTKVAHKEAFDELVWAVGNAENTDDQ